MNTNNEGDAPTPRTDKAETIRFCIHENKNIHFVAADFARQLERELAKMTAERDSLRTRLNRAEELLGEARKDSGRLDWLTERLEDAQIDGADATNFFYEDSTWPKAWRLAIDSAMSAHPSTPPK